MTVQKKNKGLIPETLPVGKLARGALVLGAGLLVGVVGAAMYTYGWFLLVTALDPRADALRAAIGAGVLAGFGLLLWWLTSGREKK